VGSGEGPPAAALVEQLEGLPGVVSVTSYPVLGGGLGRLLPGGEWRTIAGVAGGDADALSVSWMLVGPRFFETMGITVLAGRAFGRQEEPRDAVVVISEGLARRLFGSVAAAIDLPLRGAAPTGWADPIVVGVVEHVPHLSLRDPDHWAVYQPFSPFGARSPTERLVLRTDGDAARMIPAIREALAEFGHEFAIADARTLRTITEASIARERLAANLVAAFGVLAIVLLTIGVYGVVAYTVAQRTKEIGVRMALGARAGTIVATVVRQVLFVVAAGVALGIVPAVGVSQLVAHLLFGVTSADPTTLLAAAAVLVVAAGVASCLPALRAARRIDPIAALRE
jgi:putative ABC transport system permease protein